MTARTTAMRRELAELFRFLRVVVPRGHKQGRQAIAAVYGELEDAYRALPPSKGEHAPEHATLAERIRALDGDVVRWRMLAERFRAQMLSQVADVDRHEIAATAAGFGPHMPGAQRAGGCPGCQSVPERERVVIEAGAVPPPDAVPVGLVEALQDGLATPDEGATTLDIPEEALRRGVVAVMRAYLAGTVEMATGGGR